LVESVEECIVDAVLCSNRMERKMKKTIAVVLGLVMLVGCSTSLVNLGYKDGQLVNNWLRLKYNAAPVGYEPVAVGEPYGYYGEADMVLYQIPGCDPKEWLTQEYAAGATTVFYQEDIQLPTLTEMAPEKILICVESDTTFCVDVIEDAAFVADLVSAFVNGQVSECIQYDGYVENYDLKFSSSAYPQIYYNLEYIEYEEGVYLYENGTGRLVEIGDLLDAYIENGWEA